MFGKLLSHEWRTNRSLVGLICLIVGLSGMMTGGSLRNLTWSAAMGNQTMVNTYAVVLTAAVAAVVLGCLGTMYLLVYRFYKSRFTDQGYLMLTLPVTTHQHLLSSISSTVIGVLLVGLTALVSVAAGIGIYLSMFDGASAAELRQILSQSQADLAVNLGFSGVSPALMVLKGVVMYLEDIILLMLSFTLASQAHRHPVLCGAGVYIGTDVLITEGCDLITRLLENQTLAAVLTAGIYAALGSAAYFIMHRIIDRKLNLT